MSLCKAPVFIIASASSGTTLLSVMLDRHPQIASGPELYVFNKRQIYQRFNLVQRNMAQWLDEGLLSDGQIDTEVFFFNREAYFCDAKQIVSIVNSSGSLREFMDNFFDRYLRKRRKTRWVEKTGSNSYYLKQILQMYPEARIIHITRDGRDVVCSLLGRNNCPYHAVSHWLYNNAAAYAFSYHPNYLRISYENMVAEPYHILEKVCDHIGVSFRPEMLETSHDQYWKRFSSGNIHSSWTDTPFSGGISTSSIGRYKSDLSSEVEGLFWRMRLSAIAKHRLDTDCKGVQELMMRLGYISVPPSDLGPVPVELCIEGVQRYIERLKRSWHRNRWVWLPLTHVSLL